jgi:tRNA 2-selenouridine synthase
MKGPATLEERDRFDTVIDARSEAEYGLDHLPGAINCPVLDNEQRRIVGTIYKQQGAFEARRIGGAMAAENIARHLRERFADKPANWRPLVYCWRGGMRSGSMVTVLRMVGWDAQQLAGGYKRWRRHVIDTLEALAPQLNLVAVCGATGSAKTRVLQAMARQGAQVLDLEALACHKGSLLGNLPDAPQPSQTAFETALVTALEPLDLARPIFVESESRRIGKLNVPGPLIERLRASPCVEIAPTLAARRDYLLRDYAYLCEQPERLCEQLAPLKALHGRETIEAWQALARAGRYADLVEALVEQHYDPAYAKSQRANFKRWAERQVLPVDDLSEGGIEALARRVATVGEPAHGGERPLHAPASPTR